MKRKLRTKGKARPGEFEFGTASNGTQQVGLRIEIVEPDQGDEIKLGSVHTWYGYFTDKSIERTLEQLEIAGWNGVEGDDFINLTGLGSTEFELQFEEEDEFDEQGNPAGSYMKPTFINRAGVAMRNKMDDNAKRVFAADLRGTILARRQSKGSAAPTQQRPPAGGQRPAAAQQQRPPAGGQRPAYGQRPQYQDQAPPQTDDDIPF